MSQPVILLLSHFITLASQWLIIAVDKICSIYVSISAYNYVDNKQNGFPLSYHHDVIIRLYCLFTPDVRTNISCWPQLTKVLSVCLSPVFSSATWYPHAGVSAIMEAGRVTVHYSHWPLVPVTARDSRQRGQCSRGVAHSICRSCRVAPRGTGDGTMHLEDRRRDTCCCCCCLLSAATRNNDSIALLRTSRVAPPSAPAVRQNSLATSL